MAERPIQRISPLDLRRNVAVGVPFPLGGTPIFSSTFSTQDQALSNLKCLLLTRKGERPFQPLFGTDLPSFLFEQITDKLLNQLKDTIEEDIKFWLPYIKMRDIVVTKDEDRHIVNFSFTFSVGESNANQIIILEVSEQGGLSIA
tara:strand:+ start:54 stop:488 length:435 start_codon:yes stop_codon:yes gene_type:complete